nr:hypothetical protein [Tanacetum cinerariifolium]
MGLKRRKGKSFLFALLLRINNGRKNCAVVSCYLSGHLHGERKRSFKLRSASRYELRVVLETHHLNQPKVLVTSWVITLESTHEMVNLGMFVSVATNPNRGGPGYSDETFVNHPNPGMHYIAPPAPTHPSVFLPKKTPEQLKAQAASVAARLAAAKAALKAGFIC